MTRASALALPDLPGTITALSWSFPPDLSWPEYEKICQSFGAGARGLSNALQWAVGDLIVYGERKFGEKVYQALESLGYNERTLGNLARVAEVFPRARRHTLPVTFAHHAEVAALHPEEQDEWLDKAAKEGWTRAEFRKALRGGKESDPDPPACAVHICRRCGAEFTTEMTQGNDGRSRSVV